MLVALCSGASSTAAEGGRQLWSGLHVRGSDGCVDEAALRTRLAQWWRAGGRARAVEVVLDVAARPVNFQLSVAGKSVATRSFDVLPESCDERLDAIAIAIVIALEQRSPRAVAPRPARPQSREAPGRARPRPKPAEVSTRPAANGGVGGARPALPPSAASADKTPLVQAPSAASDDRAPPAAAPPPPAMDAGTRPFAPPPSAPDGRAARAPASASDVGAPAAARPGSTPNNRSQTRLFVASGLFVNVLARPVLGFGAGAELGAGHWSLDFEGWASLAIVDQLGEGRVRTQFIALQASGCARSWPAAVEVSLCAGIRGGAVWALGRDFMTNRGALLPWIAPGLGAAARYPASGLISLRLAADGFSAVVRPQLRTTLDGARLATRAVDPVGFATSLALVGEFL